MTKDVNDVICRVESKKLIGDDISEPGLNIFIYFTSRFSKIPIWSSIKL